MSFHLVDATISATGMTATQKWVLTCMSSFASEDGVCWPSVRTLAAMTGHKPDVVRGAVKALIEDGFLKKREQYRTDGGQSSNKYLINGEKLAKLRHQSRTANGWLFDDEDGSDPLPPKRGTPSPRKGGPPPPEKGDPLPPKRGTVEPIREPIIESVKPVAKATGAAKATFAQSGINTRFAELTHKYPLFGLLPFEYQSRVASMTYVRGIDVLELAGEAYHCSDWTPRKGIPQDPANEFNLEQPWHHERNYLPWEVGFPTIEKTCWTDPCLDISEVNVLRALPFFSSPEWGDEGEPCSFKMAGPYRSPYTPRQSEHLPKPLSSTSPDNARDTTQISKAPKVLLVARQSEEVPKNLLADFLKTNGDLFSQLVVKSPPTATEVKLNQLLLQIRHRTFMMSYEWKVGWLDGAMDQRAPLPGDSGEGPCIPWDTVFSLLSESVKNLRVARGAGLNYPKNGLNGKVQRVALTQYLLNQSPSGTTAPWIGFLVGNRREAPKDKIARMQAALGAETLHVAKSIQMDTPRKVEWGMEAQATYWEAVVDLVNWRKANHDYLMDRCDLHGGNKQWVSSSQAMLKMIHDCVTVTRACWLRCEFFGPTKADWDALCRWCAEHYNVNLDLNQHKPGWKRTAKPVNT